MDHHNKAQIEQSKPARKKPNALVCSGEDDQTSASDAQRAALSSKWKLQGFGKGRGKSRFWWSFCWWFWFPFCFWRLLVVFWCFLDVFGAFLDVFGAFWLCFDCFGGCLVIVGVFGWGFPSLLFIPFCVLLFIGVGLFVFGSLVLFHGIWMDLFFLCGTASSFVFGSFFFYFGGVSSLAVGPDFRAAFWWQDQRPSPLMASKTLSFPSFSSHPSQCLASPKGSFWKRKKPPAIKSRCPRVGDVRTASDVHLLGPY